MPRIDDLLRSQPREIAKQITRALDRREELKKINKPVYDGDLSWKKVSSESERDISIKYGPNESGLESLGSPGKKLNII